MSAAGAALSIAFFWDDAVGGIAFGFLYVFACFSLNSNALPCFNRLPAKNFHVALGVVENLKCKLIQCAL